MEKNSSSLQVPPSSLGRNLSRSPSRESLTTHPLLSPALSPTTSANPSHETASGNTVPYVPRKHRPPPVTAHAGTTNSSSVPYEPRHQRSTTQAAVVPVPATGLSSVTQSEGGVSPSTATSKLQIQNLKAAAQQIGLNGGSFGWMMLEKIVNEGEWEEIWSALTVGKATLLLPAEDVHTSDKITQEVFKDHIVFLDHASRSSTPVVTLSGLRGHLIGSTLTFQTMLPLTSKPFNSLRTPSSRALTLTSLVPLPSLPADHIYPKLTVYPNTTLLPLPPRSVKPILPPRPNQRSSSGVSQPVTSRVGIPFISLFAARASSPAPQTPPRPSSPNQETDRTFDISAIVIDRKISLVEVGKQVYRAVKKHMQNTLRQTGVTNQVWELLDEFLTPLLPFDKSGHPSTNTLFRDENIATVSPSDISSMFQDFYRAVEDSLGQPPVLSQNTKRKDDGNQHRVLPKSHEKDPHVSPEKVREVMEVIEELVCVQLYDRIFCPEGCDDGQHDEALASRVAALNLLDLTLEHLGVDARESSSAVTALIQQCGESLAELQSPNCRSPAQKAGVLVSVHQRLVDVLSKLPPITLKEEAEIEKPSHSPLQASHISQTSPLPPSNQIARAEDDVDKAGAESFNTNASQHASGEKTSVSEVDSGNAPALSKHDTHLPESSESHLPDLTKSTHPSEAVQISKTVTPISGDVLLPLIIYSVVKCNPANLVSHLLYVQRYRNQAVGGEESYSLVNFMAVVEFLEHVDLHSLGLGDSDRGVSADDLSPIPLDHGIIHAITAPALSTSARLKGLVVQEVDALAGSANKVISGVMDSSFGVLKGLLGPTTEAASSDIQISQATAPWNNMRPGFGLLRRASGFSIASVAASLPGASNKDKSKSGPPEEGQQMVEVSSRPGSVMEERSDFDEEGSSVESEESDSEEDAHDAPTHDSRGDTRSVRSFSSMMSSASKERRERKTLSHRLANMPGLSKVTQPMSRDSSLKETPPPSRRASMLSPSVNLQGPSQVTLEVAPNVPRIAPPKRRFLECKAYDLRLSEINELLLEYKRVVDALHALNGFEEVE